MGRFRRLVAYVTLITACWLCWAMFNDAVTLAHKWLNVKGKILPLVVTLAVHMMVRRGGEIPGLRKTTWIVVACTVGAMGLLALFTIFLLMIRFGILR